LNLRIFWPFDFSEQFLISSNLRNFCFFRKFLTSPKFS
jgi:hypothetical protein